MLIIYNDSPLEGVIYFASLSDTYSRAGVIGLSLLLQRSIIKNYFLCHFISVLVADFVYSEKHTANRKYYAQIYGLFFSLLILATGGIIVTGSHFARGLQAL